VVASTLGGIRGDRSAGGGPGLDNCLLRRRRRRRLPVYDLDGAVWLEERQQDLDRTVWSPSVSEDRPDKSRPTGAEAVVPGGPGAVSPLAAAEAKAPGLEEALAGQHGGVLKWMLSSLASH
jgi:hypothetical protein